METCETCRWWMFDTPDWQFDDLRIGECKRVKQREVIEDEATRDLVDGRWNDAAEDAIKSAMQEARAIVVDGSGYYAALRTMPDFGCNRHEYSPTPTKEMGE